MKSEYKKLIYKKLFFGVILHALILWAALALGYNSYKEFVKEFEPLSINAKNAIKATFPWAILIFLSLYSAFSIRKKRAAILLGIWQYASIIIFYIALINLFISSKGRDVLIPLNLSILYFVIILICLFGLKRLVVISNIEQHLPKAQDYLPPVIYRFLMSNLPKIRSYIKEKPSAPFIVGFMILLIMCAFLLIFKAEKTAEQLANIAYFSLVIGVGIEVYRMIKYGKHDTTDKG